MVVALFLLSCGSRELSEVKNISAQPETYPTKSILHFMYGEIYRSTGNFPYANLEYKRALEYDTSATILAAIAESYLRMGKIQPARDYFEKALQIDPEDAAAQDRIADIYIRESRFEKAIPVLQRLLEKDPGNTGLLRKLAESYRRNGDHEASLEVLDRIIALRPEIPWSYIYAAEIMFESGNAAGAAQYLETVIPMVPPNDDLYELWVRSLYEKEEHEKIPEVLKAWIETGTEGTGPHLMYADLQFRSGNADSARKVLAMIGDRWREDARIPYLQGIGAMLEEEQDSVFFYFERAADLPDAGDKLYYDYALWFWEQGELASAEYIADRAMERFGPEARWLHMKALIERQKGDLEASGDLLLRLLKEDPENRAAREDLANIYIESGKRDAADSLYRDLLNETPEDPAILNNYAFSLARMDRDLKKAMDLVDKALEQRKNAAYCDTKAWILYRQGKYRRALRWVNRALRYPDTGSEIYFHKGRILQVTGRDDSAREAFRQALLLDPGNRLAKQALEEMK